MPLFYKKRELRNSSGVCAGTVGLNTACSRLECWMKVREERSGEDVLSVARERVGGRRGCLKL